MSGRKQELLIVFDRERQACLPYRGMPWEAEGEEIVTVQRAVITAAEVQGLGIDGPEEIRQPIEGPHATLFFQWGYPGSVDMFLSEEPLLGSEQAIVAAALATLPGWQMGCWWQGNTHLPLLEHEAPQPFSHYRALPALACPSKHPATVLAVGMCDHCAAQAQQYGIWPTRCAVCGSDRDRAFRLLEQQGYICPVCLPMEQGRIGQARAGM
ncbi:MAG TPA: hypothetical protein VKT82_15595 [Ktedonobacterales bacterium]|nr:hypothetical protein [Ktedonobacterales bacterium]